MRLRIASIVLFTVAAVVLAVVVVLWILTARSEARLQASLARAQDVLDLPRPFQGNPGAFGPPHAPVADAPVEDGTGWRELYRRVTEWLALTGYDQVPIPPLYLRGRDQLEPPPDAPEELILDIRRLAATGKSNFDVGPDMDHEEYDRYLDTIFSYPVLLAEHARRMMEQASFDEALEDFVAAMRLADLFGRRLSAERHHEIYASLQAYFQLQPLPDTVAASIVEHLAHADARERLRALCGWEVQGTLDFYAWWQGMEYVTAVQEIGFYWGTRNWLWAQSLAGPHFSDDQQQFTEIVTRMAEIADRPYYEIAPQLREIEDDIQRYSPVFFGIQANLQRLLDTFADQAMHEARLDIMQMGLLLEQYHAREGAYPEYLDAIAAGLGGELPVDPFNGTHYHYELQGDGFFLYSEGLGDDSGPAWRGAPSEDASTDLTF